jgi:hypothetical protein
LKKTIFYPLKESPYSEEEENDVGIPIVKLNTAPESSGICRQVAYHLICIPEPKITARLEWLEVEDP